MLTPDLPWGFPHWEFFVFFGLHGLVIVAALVLVFGLGLTPSPRRALAGLPGHPRPGRAWPGPPTSLLEMNFMFLRGKPQAATPLDWMGPWPIYILTGAGVALVAVPAPGPPLSARVA